MLFSDQKTYKRFSWQNRHHKIKLTDDQILIHTETIWIAGSVTWNISCFIVHSNSFVIFVNLQFFSHQSKKFPTICQLLQGTWEQVEDRIGMNGEGRKKDLVRNSARKHKRTFFLSFIETKPGSVLVPVPKPNYKVSFWLCSEVYNAQLCVDNFLDGSEIR